MRNEKAVFLLVVTIFIVIGVVASTMWAWGTNKSLTADILCGKVPGSNPKIELFDPQIKLPPISPVQRLR